MTAAWAEDVLSFWFTHLGEERWFRRDEDIDRQIRRRFRPLWQELKKKPVDHFLDDARKALGAVILFDQFPRNMFRGTASAFASDHLAIQIATRAVERGYDDGLGEEQRLFLYMPFMHSEKLGDQQRSLALFTALGRPENLDYAHRHHDLIARFGRFPHRNEVLGRETRPEELEAVSEFGG